MRPVNDVVMLEVRRIAQLLSELPRELAVEEAVIQLLRELSVGSEDDDDAIAVGEEKEEEKVRGVDCGSPMRMRQRSANTEDGKV